MRRPASTYRIQLSPDFGFRAARRLVPYLSQLGVDALYLSPILAPRPGSSHGYDTADPTRLNPALGTDEDFELLTDTARAHGLGVVLDIVPNHMAASVENPWWRDVLMHGKQSRFADFFDIDWQPPWPAGEDRVLIPTLGDHYAKVLERGELQVQAASDGFAVHYYDNVFPLAPDTCTDLDESQLDSLNADPSALDALLAQQHYQLRYWKTERYELNYRRFFNISDLVGMRIEDLTVRQATHQRLAELWVAGRLTGLRVDHIDGLREPRAYLEWLRETFRESDGSAPYILVEKILAPNETLPDDWPVAGTTGYEYLNKLNGVFVDPDGHRKLNQIYADFTGRDESFSTVVYQKKRFVIDWLFKAELDRLTRDLMALAAEDRLGRGLPREQLARALAEVSACLPLYRTYVSAAPVSEDDADHIRGAVAEARERADDVDAAAYDFVERALLLDFPAADSSDALDFVLSWQQFTPPVMAKGLEDTSLYVYNHLISLNTVGGEPDEADVSLGEFHAFNRRRVEHWPAALSSTSTHDSKRGEDVRLRVDVLSEMPDDWRARLERWSEWNESKKIHPDVAEPPSRNEEMLLYQTLLGSWPLDAEEKEVYPGRLREYLVKSAREAKEKSSWQESDERHEYALARFAERLLDDSTTNRFLDDFEEFQAEIAFYGAMYSLSQVVLKNASPGVPDLYQGSEFWNLSLVDPDNRRPVDWEARRAALDEMQDAYDQEPAAIASTLLEEWADARIKQFVTWRSLQNRREHSKLYIDGDYRDLYGIGKCRPYICAFARSLGDAHVIAVAPRRLSRLVDPFELPIGQVWDRCRLRLPGPLPAAWTNVLTGESVSAAVDGERALPLDQAFATLPVALLAHTPA